MQKIIDIIWNFRNEIKEWSPMEFIIAISFIAIIAAIPLGIMAAIEEQKVWEKYYVEQNCKPIGTRKRMVTTYVNNGTGVMAPLQSPTTDHGYSCDDGQEHWR